MLRRDAAYLTSKVPPKDQTLHGGVRAAVEIRWDEWGVPHITAAHQDDLFYAFGYAMAQECLWRLEYCRTQARGRLAAIFGPDAVASDRSLRTIGLPQHVDTLAARLPADEEAILRAFSAGINRWIEQALAENRLPVEFDWLGVTPSRWDIADCIACWKGRWWNFTGRLDNIVVGEAARRLLPPHLYDAFMSTEHGEESIVPDSAPLKDRPSPVPGGADTGEGSNNWAVAGSRTTTGYPVLCSDPHTPFFQPGQWFEVHLALTDGSFEAAGTSYVGWPAIYMGRNRHLAWGFTNHVASTRDLYVEKVEPDDPSRYREGDTWRPFAVEEHNIEVRGAAPVPLTVRRTVRGPVVSAMLPDIGGPAETVTLRWAGVEVGTGLTAMLALNRARSVEEGIEALRDWPHTVLNGMLADAEGNIGYHVAGFVPKRAEAARRFRDATNPDDAWQGDIPFDQLPHAVNPARGWLASANQPPWRHDPPGLTYLRGAAWADGGRMKRIRQRLEGDTRMTPAEIASIQADDYSVRAAELAPRVVAHLAESPEPPARQVRDFLQGWDAHYSVESVAPTVWTAFWERWLRTVARRRFPERLVNLAATQAGAVARQVLLGEPVGLEWADGAGVTQMIAATAREAVEWLTASLGAGPAHWRWGDAHTVTWEHPLGNQGPAEMREPARALFDVGPFPTSGGPTVRAAGYSTAHPFRVQGGASYRLVADLSPEGGLMTTATTGQSGHPGSPHYADQSPLWLEDRYHPCWRDGSQTEAVTRLEPA